MARRKPSGACPKPGTAVTWQAELPAARKISSYALTSADDMPVRDPKEWSLDGSNDGQQWTTLDKQTMPEPFANRFEEKRFQVASPGEYRFYRFTFIPRDEILPARAKSASPVWIYQNPRPSRQATAVTST